MRRRRRITLEEEWEQEREEERDEEEWIRKRDGGVKGGDGYRGRKRRE